ncbi:MAG: diphthine synthase [Nanoarchaeota archaeon]|nr:diphthine synthase [Nanoarchaeota archaeon]MBU1005793.1 diphthine synthase [Nanoarchaeota archaeon]MBU1946575.1 diphthine synthase [Nanoarchaeota archaeon]
MTLYFVGLGLGNEKDITVKGLEAVKKADVVYLEVYTSKLVKCDKAKLEKFYGKRIIAADRDLVENKASETILKDAADKDVAFLVVGDVFSATTHVDLRKRAGELKIKTKVIHNTSILTAVGIVGLDMYKYGRVTTIPFDNKNVKSPYEVIKKNLKNDLHTLVLLDLDPLHDKYMNVKLALEYLLKCGMPAEQLCVCCCGVGSEDILIKFGEAKELIKKEFNKYPQCLIVPSKMHFMEEEALGKFKI